MAARSPSIGRALASALREAKLDKRDAGAIALAKRLAMLLDQAEHLVEQLDAVEADDAPTLEVIVKLRAKVDAQTVASDLGPKLLAALTALGLTPAARSAVAKGGTTGEPGSGDPAAATLRRLRDQAAARRSG